MRTTPVLVVAAALGLLAACDNPDQRQAWQSPTSPTGTSSTRPPIEGAVIVAGAGPLAFATVSLVDRNGPLRTLQTDAAGGFQIPASGLGCGGSSTLRAEKAGYHHRDLSAPGCVSASDPRPVAVSIKVQEYLAASESAPVHTTLSNDDLDWSAGNTSAPPCGPCKLVSLPEPKSEPLEVTIEWSTSDRLSFWLTASDGYYDAVALGNWQAAPGARTHTITIEPSNGANFYYGVFIGLPVGSRATGGLTGIADLRVSVKELTTPSSTPQSGGPRLPASCSAQTTRARHLRRLPTPGPR